MLGEVTPIGKEGFQVIGHKEGLKSSFDLTQAQNQLLSSEGNLVGARLQMLYAHARLIAATTTTQK